MSKLAQHVIQHSSLYFKRLLTALTISILPISSIASEYPASPLPDPLWQRTCPVNYFGSNSPKCELLGLAGPVEKVTYSNSDRPYIIFQFNNKGQLIETRRRIQDALGGWGILKFSYASDMLLKSSTYNDQPNTEYLYSGGKLSKVVSYVNKNTCEHKYSEIDKDILLMDASCKNNLRSFDYQAKFDSIGRILSLDKTGAQQMNAQGPLECSYPIEDGISTSICTDGYYFHKYEYDKQGRPISYIRRKMSSDITDLKLSFSYTDDTAGNWTEQTVHYIEMYKTTKLPSDFVSKRTIDYFK
jgi:hypothetical protein